MDWLSGRDSLLIAISSLGRIPRYWSRILFHRSYLTLILIWTKKCRHIWTLLVFLSHKSTYQETISIHWDMGRGQDKGNLTVSMKLTWVPLEEMKRDAIWSNLHRNWSNGGISTLQIGWISLSGDLSLVKIVDKQSKWTWFSGTFSMLKGTRTLIAIRVRMSECNKSWIKHHPQSSILSQLRH